MHHWKDLVFDILQPDLRAEYLHDGGTLPITHEVAPLTHADMCQSMLAGALGSEWEAHARVSVEHDENGYNIDFSTLDDCHRMMLRADAHARSKSNPPSEPASKPAVKKPILTSKAKGRR